MITTYFAMYVFSNWVSILNYTSAKAACMETQSNMAFDTGGEAIPEPVIYKIEMDRTGKIIKQTPMECFVAREKK